MRVATRLALLLPLAWLAVSPVAAQFEYPAEPCLRGTAEGVLRGADVQASLFSSGVLFEGNQTSNGYLVPLSGEDAGKSAVFISNIWVGGKVLGEVRVAGGVSTSTFRPGLTGDDLTPPSPEACAEADRVWVVSREDIANYLDGNPPEVDLAEWPVYLGAPVLDGDGVEGNYDLASGDQPALRGDVTAFWAMTDTAFRYTGLGLPLGVDVTVEAFAFRQALFAQHTFFHLTVTNRNRVPIDSAYVGLFAGIDLGDSLDNYAATDTTSHMVFTYNMDETDAVYGVPPALGIVILEGPLAPEPNDRDDDRDGETDEAGERLGLTSSIPAYNGGGPLSLPSSGQKVYNRLRGLRNDGAPMYAYGSGFGGSGVTGVFPTTPFLFHADPVAGEFWSAENTDGIGTSLGSRVDLYSLGSGPFILQPQSSATATFAYVFAQGTDRFDSVQRLRGQARGVHAAQASGAFEPARVSGPNQMRPLAIGRPRPNPFSITTAVEVQGAAETPVRVSVYDVLGRRLSTTETIAPEARVEVGRDLASGVYVVRVEGRGFAETFTVAKVQ